MARKNEGGEGETVRREWGDGGQEGEGAGGGQRAVSCPPDDSKPKETLFNKTEIAVKMEGNLHITHMHACNREGDEGERREGQLKGNHIE